MVEDLDFSIRAEWEMPVQIVELVRTRERPASRVICEIIRACLQKHQAPKKLEFQTSVDFLVRRNRWRVMTLCCNHEFEEFDVGLNMPNVLAEVPI